MPRFDPTQTYTTVVDVDGTIIVLQSGVYYDRFGNNWTTIPYSKNGWFPPTMPTGGGGATNWQTYTPNVSNAVHISLDRNSGPNVMLNSPVDNTQIVDVPLNVSDGQEMQINLVGGGGSGSWTTWSGGAPTTSGFVFLSGFAPTAPGSSANYVPLYVKRRGFKYEVTTGTSATV